MNGHAEKICKEDVGEIMREYPVKKTVKMSNDYIIDIVKSELGDYKVLNDHITSSYPGLKKLELWTDGIFYSVFQ